MQMVLQKTGGVKSTTIFTPHSPISFVCILHFALLVHRSLHRLSDSRRQSQRVTPGLRGDAGGALRADGVDEVRELPPQRLIPRHLELAAFDGGTSRATHQP